MEKGQSKIRINVIAFDDVDVRFIAKQKLNLILDLVAGTIWHRVVFISAKNKSKNEILNIPSNIYKSDMNFDINDDECEKNGLLYLPKKVIEIISDISKDSKISNDETNLLKACKVFHSALKLELLGWENFSHDIDIYEILITKYMTVLEILSIKDDKGKVCDKCGQKIYSISKRIKEYLKNVFPHSEYHVKKLYGIYTDRSKYLHTGKNFSSRSYLGTTIPQLQKSGNLLEHQLLIENGEIKYAIGMCIEYFINNLQNKYQ